MGLIRQRLWTLLVCLASVYFRGISSLSYYTQACRRATTFLQSNPHYQAYSIWSRETGEREEGSGRRGWGEGGRGGEKRERSHLSFFIHFFLFLVFVVVVAVALGLHCFVQDSYSCGKQGLLFVGVHRLLTVVASLVGVCSSRVQVQYLWHMGLAAPSRQVESS